MSDKMRIPKPGDEMRHKVWEGRANLHELVGLLRTHTGPIAVVRALADMEVTDLVFVAYAGVLLSETATSHAYELLDHLHTGVECCDGACIPLDPYEDEPEPSEPVRHGRPPIDPEIRARALGEEGQS